MCFCFKQLPFFGVIILIILISFLNIIVTFSNYKAIKKIQIIQ